LFADPQDIKAEFGFTPTFVTRQNTQGDYGDNQQDFFMTFTQRDWSLGEQQRYQGRDDDGKRRYWTGGAVDVVSVPGQVSVRKIHQSFSAAAGVTAVCDGAGGGAADRLYYTTSTKLYEVSPTAVTDLGAHGLGTSPTGIVYDGNNVLMSGTGGGTVGIRRYNLGGAAFSTFSATAADSLAFLNNTLYGIREAQAEFMRYDTAGTMTSIFIWKDAVGTASMPLGGFHNTMVPFGGKLAMLLNANAAVWSLWVYDGVAPAKVADLPPNFWANQLVVAEGSMFVSGVAQRRGDAKAGIYYYTNGTTGFLWNDTAWSSTSTLPMLTQWEGGLVWDVPRTGSLLYYNIGTGGVSNIASNVSGGNTKGARSSSFFIFVGIGGTTVIRFPSGSTTAIAGAGFVATSLIDFDSSLTKLFRSVKVDFDSATDGDGGSVDIEYRIGDVDSTYTNLKTGATTGVEYPTSGAGFGSGRSVSIKVWLNKGTSTNGPVLKRISLRAAPVQPSFIKTTYVLRLEGIRGRGPTENEVLMLRNGTPHNKDAAQMVADLKTAATSTSTITVVDEVNGSYTGVIDGEGFKIQKSTNGGFWATVPVRQV